ncbi:MAG TPA: hypothetical protein VGD74_05040 [Vulgatibacter sp.]
MQLVELFLQGVKGFPTQARIAFSPGLVVLRPEGAELRRAIEALLYLDDRADAELELEDPEAAASRLALTYRTRNGAGWRLVRDLRGGCALQRLDDGAGRFSTVTSQAGEIGPYLRSQAGLPGRSCFSELFTLGAGDFPSKRLGPKSEPMPAPGEALGPVASFMAGAGGIVPRPQPAGFGAVEPRSAERIRALEEELSASREIEALEARLDEIRGRLHAMDERFKVVPAAEAELAAAREASAAFTASVSDGLAVEIAGYGDAGEKRDAAIARIVEEQERLAERAARPISAAPAGDWRFWVATGLGAAFLVTASATAWKHLALLGIPTFGAAAALALIFVGDLQRRDSLGRRRAHLAGREKKAHEQWQAETLEVRRAMAAIGVDRAADLEAWIAARADARRRVAAAEEALREAVEDPRFAEAKARLEALRSEESQVEDTLAAKGAGAWRSSAEVARELEHLANPDPYDGVGHLGGSGALTGAGALAVIGGVASGGDVFAEARPVAKASAAGEDPSARLLDRAAELLAESRIALFGSLAPRASAYLAALTRKRLTSFSWSDAGGVRCAGGDGESAFEHLPEGERDLAWLALRLAIVERQQAKGPLPFILDDPFASVPADLHPLLAKMVRGLGARGQVIHCTAIEAMAAQP